MSKKEKILFLCTNNSARSQIAEGIVNHFYSERFDAKSAGSKPTSVHPLAIKVLSEIGIDISNQRSKSVEEFLGIDFDYVISLCGDDAKNTCPIFLGKAKQKLHWNFLDPAEVKGSYEEVIGVFRKVRDEIKMKIEELFKYPEGG